MSLSQGLRVTGKCFEDGSEVEFEESNPKRTGTGAHARYEVYKTAKTIGQARELGASNPDLKAASDSGAMSSYGGIKIGKKELPTTLQETKGLGANSADIENAFDTGTAERAQHVDASIERNGPEHHPDAPSAKKAKDTASVLDLMRDGLAEMATEEPESPSVIAKKHDALKIKQELLSPTRRQFTAEAPPLPGSAPVPDSHQSTAALVAIVGPMPARIAAALPVSTVNADDASRRSA